MASISCHENPQNSKTSEEKRKGQDKHKAKATVVICSEEAFSLYHKETAANNEEEDIEKALEHDIRCFWQL